tara:strand:+ start:2591 stop:5023 length:2433 start_codon:yes stop_codon:yes gene_type:complete
MSTIFDYSSRDIITGLSKVFKLDNTIDLNKILDIIRMKHYTIILATGGDETMNYSTKIEVPQLVNNVIIYKTDTEVKNKCIVDNTYVVHNYPILSRKTFKLPLHVKESHIYTYAFSNGKIITIQPLHRLAHTDGTLSKAFNTSDLLVGKCSKDKKMIFGGCCKKPNEKSCKHWHLCCNAQTSECSPLEGKCRGKCTSAAPHRCDALSGGACCKSESYCVSTATATKYLHKYQQKKSQAPNGYGCSPCNKSSDHPHFCQTIFETVKPYGQWAYCAKDHICEHLAGELFGVSVLYAVYISAILAASAALIVVAPEAAGPLVGEEAEAVGALCGAMGAATMTASTPIFTVKFIDFINSLKKKGKGYIIAPGPMDALNYFDTSPQMCEVSLKKLNYVGHNTNSCGSLETCALDNSHLQNVCNKVLKSPSGCATCHDYCQLAHPGWDDLDIIGTLNKSCSNDPTDPSCAYACYACECSYNIPELCRVRAGEGKLPRDHSCCDPTSLKSYNINEQGCCLTSEGYTIYDLSKSICCDNTIVPNNYACCKNMNPHINDTSFAFAQSTEFFYDPKISKCCTRTPLNYTPSGEAIDPSSTICDIGDYCGHDMSGYYRCKTEGLVEKGNPQCPAYYSEGIPETVIPLSSCSLITQDLLNSYKTVYKLSCDNIYLLKQEPLSKLQTYFCANNDDPKRDPNYPCRDTSAYCQRYLNTAGAGSSKPKWQPYPPAMPPNIPAPTPTNEITDCRKVNQDCNIDITREDDTNFNNNKGDCCDGYVCRSHHGVYIQPTDPWICTAPTPSPSGPPPAPTPRTFFCPPYC